MFPSRYILLILLLVCPGIGAQAEPSHDEASADLKAVVKQVESLQKELASQRRQQTKAEQALSVIEKAEQAARSELTKIRERQKEIRARQEELSREADKQALKLKEQRAQLGEQLYAAYVNGREEWLRMSLSQQDPTQIGRQQTYYNYLSEARAQLVAVVLLIIDELAVTRAAIDAAADELNGLEKDASAKVADIAANRKAREKVLTTIAANITSKDIQIKRLKAQEKKLSDLVVALEKMLANVPVRNAEPFAGKTASLVWPADGTLLQQFGQPRADGRLKWQGVLIGAKLGADVRAIYHGRVVFADWLDGLGLLIIVEHGGGYMSLYGHNQSLLKAVGQSVAMGESIAKVGDTGGQAISGLYFEIRKNGKARNPRNWIK